MKHLIPCYLLFFSSIAFAQTGKPDTSFTVYSAFEKEKKNYPFITIAKPQNLKTVKIKSGIVYHTIGTKKLHLDVFYPVYKKRKPLPAVLLIFGGGWRSGNRSMNNAVAERLAANGYVAISVDYRLSTEALYPAAIHDIKTSIRWMRAHALQFKIDTNKIAVMGFSAGGQLAALVGTTNGKTKFDGNGPYSNYSSNVSAVIDIDGILAFDHPESGESGFNPAKPSAATLWFGGTLKEKPELWQEASALTHVSKNTVPILFVNSSLPRFHAGRDDMIKKLDSLKIYSIVHTIPDTPHPFWLFNPWFEPTMKYSLAFLDKVLKRLK